MHRDSWYGIVKNGKVVSLDQVKLEVDHENSSLSPHFIRETSTYVSKEELRTKVNFKEFIDKAIKDLERFSGRYSDINYALKKQMQEIGTFDEFVDYLNGKGTLLGKPLDSYGDPVKKRNPQPISYSLNPMGLTSQKRTNQSNCVISLYFVNNGSVPLDDYKIYLEFKNVIAADSVDKQKEYIDFNKYRYNVQFSDDCNAVFVPESSTLVQTDKVKFDLICMATEAETKEVVIQWRMVARGQNQSGILVVPINPIYKSETKTVYVDNPLDHSAITNYLEKIT